MKRLLTIAAASVLLTSGCAASTDASATKEKPVVLTTFTVLADMARNVAGDDIQVESITKVGAEIHGYEPTPGDMKRAANADLLLDNGLNLEAWFEKFTADLDVPHVVISDGVEPIDIAVGESAGSPNPHAWMSPLNAVIYVDNIAQAFAELDPDNADAYQQRAADYTAEILAVHDELTDGLATLPRNQRALVTCEGAFSYLARDADLTEAFIWPVNAEQQATPGQIAATIDFVRDNRVPAVFCESTVSDAPMQRVVDATGTSFGGVLYVDSLSEPDGPVPTYLELLRHDADVIVTGLTEAGRK